MDTYLETQTKILESETLAMQTIQSLDLGKYPEFGGTSGIDGVRAAAGPRFSGRRFLGAFLGDLSVKRVPEQPLDRGEIRCGKSSARG